MKEEKAKPEEEQMQEAVQEEDEQADNAEEVTNDEDIEKINVTEEEAPAAKVRTESGWQPKTTIGKKVKSGEIKDIDDILRKGENILEAEIIDQLLPDIKTELLMIGQSKGKFGGGQRRIFKQTQKKTREGNKPRFSTYAIVGNENGYIGYGTGKAKETVPAREKAMRNAKLNLFRVVRGCGSWECSCGTPHSIPVAVKGKCGSVEIELIPAPKGTGLCVETECQKILKLCGIKDIWSKTKGHTKTKFNLVTACLDALQNLIQIKINEKQYKTHGVCVGKTEQKIEAEQNE